ncbi:MAG: hypothetical protein Q4E46_00495 [Candidatus Saccharibacteria bacterium]|nr:hypothetical protein [Candidatus Saccharibacteria bacterium]
MSNEVMDGFGVDRIANSSNRLWACYENIWSIYYNYWKGRYVQRIGRANNGPNVTLSEEEMWTRPESTNEHQATTGLLWGAIILVFPDFVPKERQFETLFEAITHDVSEGILGKDAADNGNAEHELAKVAEDGAVKSFLRFFPDAYRRLGYQDHCAFEKPEETEDTVMIALKMVDKLDAVLGYLADEKAKREFDKAHGKDDPEPFVGRINAMSRDPSNRDLKRTDYLETDVATDTWMFGLRKKMASCKVPSDICDLIMGIAYVAFMDVRNIIPNCLAADVWAVE